MSKITLTFEPKSFKGRIDGKFIYAVVFIDKDDSEDATTEMWLANDPDDLQEQVKKDCILEDDMDDEVFDREGNMVTESERFDSDWEMIILWTELGRMISHQHLTELIVGQIYTITDEISGENQNSGNSFDCEEGEKYELTVIEDDKVTTINTSTLETWKFNVNEFQKSTIMMN